MDLSIIIVSWNVKDLLKKCLDSIYRQTKGITFEVFVVDNNSNDGTQEWLRYSLEISKYQNIEVILNQNNLGFAAANNQAIRQANGEFILLLNPDTEILDNAFKTMVDWFQRNPKIGVGGCRLLNSDGSLQRSVRRYPDFLSPTLISLNLHKFFPLKKVKKYLALDFDYNKTQEVEQIMGACFMIRKRTIEQIGLLDKKFFIWFEEVDFCRRAQRAGWQVWYLSEASIIHHGAESFSQALTFAKQKIFVRSLLHYHKKHKQWGAYLFNLLFYPLRWILSFFLSFFEGDKKKI